MKRVKPLFLFSLLFITACSSSKHTLSKQSFSFDYTPNKSNKGGSANMILAFMQPYYVSGFVEGQTELFTNLRSALNNHIEQLIIAKGFSVKGPYTTFDDMVYEDKKRTDMIIQIEIAPEFSSAVGNWHQHIAVWGNSNFTYSYSGTVTLGGKINITGTEPLTNEKIWSRSISIPEVENIVIETTGKYIRELYRKELIDDPGVYNAIGIALTKQYNGIVANIEAQFNPEELNLLKEQIKELKSKKGF